jgi:archaemetzincin
MLPDDEFWGLPMKADVLRRCAFLAALAASLIMFVATAAAEEGGLEVIRQARASLWPEDTRDFTRLAMPGVGDWLATFREEPQSLERYKFTCRTRPAQQRNAIVLQPLVEAGAAQSAEEKQLLETLREYCETFFQLPTRIATPLELPDFTRRSTFELHQGRYSRQYDANKLLERFLVKRLPDDAVAFLGITMADLWSSNLNYVFGIGSLNWHVGVYSLCRYFPEFWGEGRKPGDKELALSRACKLLNHETGHIFGLSHCVFYHCSMNGTNSLAETDRAPLHYCPICHRKLQWNIGFDPLKRYAELYAFYQKHNLPQEAGWLASRIQNWKLAAAHDNAPLDE